MKKKKIINNGLREKHILVNENIPNGWVLGRIPFSRERKNNMKKAQKLAWSNRTKEQIESFSLKCKDRISSNKGRIWIHKDNESKMVLPDSLEFFKKEGWLLGQTEEHKRKNSTALSGKNNPMYGVHRYGKLNPMYGISRFGKESPMYGKHHTEEVKQKNREKHLGNTSWCKGLTKETDERVKRVSEKQKNKSVTLETREKLSNFRKGKTYEELMSSENATKKRKQQRKMIIERAKINGNKWLAYNKKACEFFRTFEEKYNLPKGQYALYGGGEKEIQDLGYFVDYYNESLKLIIEWDEEGHFNRKTGLLKEKDQQRQREIQDLYPNFTFLRIREKNIKNNNFSMEVI